jgi:hypothetical protein
VARRHRRPRKAGRAQPPDRLMDQGPSAAVPV